MGLTEDAWHVIKMGYLERFPLLRWMQRCIAYGTPPGYSELPIAEIDYYEGTIEIAGGKYDLQSFIRISKRAAIIWGMVNAIRFSRRRYDSK